MDLYDQLPNSKLAFLQEYAVVLDCLIEKRVTVTDLLTRRPTELARIVPRSINEIASFQQALKNEYEELLFGPKRSSLAVVQDCIREFTTGDRGIDEVLGGGIRTHGITEVFGGSSTGKSQFLMQLALTVQVSVEHGGLNGKCVFITTEGSISTKRLEELIANKSKQLPGFEQVSQDNIFTVNCNDLANQEHTLQVQLPILIERNPDIKLVVVDSISHHLRVELERRSFRDSQDNRHYIDQMAQHLLKLANDYSLAVVVANQVGDKPVPEPSAVNSSPNGDFTSYGYQIGWTVGWKDSTIYYRQVQEGLLTDSVNKAKPQQRGNIESILSEDEDYRLVAEAAFARKRPRDEENTSKESNRSSSPSLASARTETSTSPFPKFLPMPLRRRRKVETKIPNLGLSWANHLSVRIMLSKIYRASPMIRRGELDLNEVMDTNNFWQVHRTFRVIFSEYSKKPDVEFIISSSGIESITQVKQSK
ncbi:LAFA_0E14796g1_1 [Lachancea sp. 'fantastica']|nr:LAFA_0E14796g1_1 [Lachancea sp. 'fantastica']